MTEFKPTNKTGFVRFKKADKVEVLSIDIDNDDKVLRFTAKLPRDCISLSELLKPYGARLGGSRVITDTTLISGEGICEHITAMGNAAQRIAGDMNLTGFGPEIQTALNEFTQPGKAVKASRDPLDENLDAIVNPLIVGAGQDTTYRAR